MPGTLLLVPRIQNAIYTLFRPIQTKGADYTHHNTTSPPPHSQFWSCGLTIYCSLYPHRLFPLRLFSIAV